MQCCKLTDARCKLLFATEDDILLLHVRRKTALVERRARRRASSNIPSIAGAAYWSVDEMKGIRQGIKDDSGSGIDTCPLAYGSRKTLIATGECHGAAVAFFNYVPLSFLKDFDYAHSSLVLNESFRFVRQFCAQIPYRDLKLVAWTGMCFQGLR